MMQINFIAKGNGICADDFNEKQRVEHVNEQQISSITDLIRFELPFSGKFIGTYSIINMQNGNSFYICRDEYERIINLLYTKS